MGNCTIVIIPTTVVVININSMIDSIFYINKLGICTIHICIYTYKTLEIGFLK